LADGQQILFTCNDSPYTDIHILASDQKTLAGLDGSDRSRVAGPLYVDPDRSRVAGPLYVDPDRLGEDDRYCAFDWWRGR
jgi:hypothetical protein